MVTIVSFGIAIGAIWEMIEWSADQLFGLKLAPGLTDTITDLMVDALGAIALPANWAMPGQLELLREDRRG